MQTRTPSGHRVVVTGMGLLSPVGNDVQSAWRALVDGVSGAALITGFETSEEYDVRFACEVKDFDPVDYMDRKEARRTDRFAQFAIAVAEQAMRQAGLVNLDGVDRDRIGVILGTGIGGMATFEEQSRIMIERGPKRVSPFFVPMFIGDIAAGLVAMRYGLRGPNLATVSACASSAHALGYAFRVLQRGEANAVVAGGTEATITPLTIAGFSSMRALSTRNDSPGTASRPFDAGRDGFVIGEGGGAMVLETLEHALQRGADIIGEIVGFGQTADAYHLTAPAPEGAGAQLAIHAALNDAGAAPFDVDYINTHGTSTPHNDIAETQAIKAVFGEHAYKLVASSTKSNTGHLLGAAGAVETIFTLLTCANGLIPATINFNEPDPECDLDYAHNRNVEKSVGLALTNSFGFGGHNVCLAVRGVSDLSHS